MNAAFSYVCESLGYSAAHERLRRKGNLSTLNPGFQQIAHIETDLLADVLWDDHLIFALDGDECHDGFPAEFFFSIVAVKQLSGELALAAMTVEDLAAQLLIDHGRAHDRE
jgi:hypothetical protein